MVDLLIFLAATLTTTGIWTSTTHPSPHVSVIRPTFVAGLVVTLLGLLNQVGGIALLGGTLGQWTVGLRVIRLDGSRVGWGRAALRVIVTLGMPVALYPTHGSWAAVGGWLRILWPFVVYLPILSGPWRRGLHDRAAGTIVVERPRRIGVPLASR